MFQKEVVATIKRDISYPLYFFFPENCAVYDKMWNNFVEPGSPQMTVWRICIPCWIPTATNTHSEHVILIDFALQQCLSEHTSLFCFMYSACLVHCYILDLLFSNSVCCKWKPCGIKLGADCTCQIS